MQIFAFVSACLACASHARRVQASLSERLESSPVLRNQQAVDVPESIRWSEMDGRASAKDMDNTVSALAGFLLSGNPPAASFHPLGPGVRSTGAPKAAARSPSVRQQFNYPKSNRQMTREAWEKADAFRPGKANWFTKQEKDIVSLHKQLLPQIEELEVKDPPGIPGAGNETSLMSSLLKSLTTGDLALTLCSPEAPVLKDLRDWLIKKLPMPEAVVGLPEEQGRVLSTIAKALDARKMLDLGTYTGYSSISMALATANDARVICCEPNVVMGKHAIDWWKKAGVTDKMEMHETTAQVMMQKMLDNGEALTVDMIFCDVGQREQYGELHELAMQLLRVGGVVVYYDTLWPADSVLQHGYYPAMREFNARLARDPRVLASLVPLSYGITICTKVMSVDGVGLAAARSAAEAGDSEPLKQLLLERKKAAKAELEALPVA